MATNFYQQGFIFVNEHGEYATPGLSSGHGPTREIVNWVKDINQAYVFPHEAMVRRRFKQLEKCRALKAVATREVLIRDWNSEQTAAYPWQEPPKIPRKAPWEDQEILKGMSESDKQRYLNGEFRFEDKQEPETSCNPGKPAPYNVPQRTVHISANCMRDARKALGVFPYDEPGNYLVGDGYFSRSCIGKYGQKMWDAACEQVRNEKKRR